MIIALIVILGILLLLLVVLLIISHHVIHIVCYPYNMPYDEAIENAIKHKRIIYKDFQNHYKMEDFEVKSLTNDTIKGTFIYKTNDVKFDDLKERVVILSHGFGANRYQMLRYADIYLSLGFNVIIYDQRNHLYSYSKPTTMGDIEADDLECIVKYAFEKLGYNIVIGTHGESMGGATVMIHAGRYHSVSFAIEDSGYNSLKDLAFYQLRHVAHLPKFVYPFASMFFKFKTKRFIGDVTPSKYLETLDDIPMYFIHGLKDDFVPTHMVYKCYDSKNGYKKLSLYENSEHVHSLTDHYDEYKNNIIEFLKEAKII